MKYKLAYVDEEDTSLSNFYSHFSDLYELHMIEVNEESSIDSILRECFGQEVDAIVTDYKLEDGNVNFNGDKLFDAIKSIYPHFPFIMLTSWEPEAIDHMKDVHLIYNKNILDGKKGEEFENFKSRIDFTIKNYNKKIEDVNNRIEELSELKHTQGLGIKQEEELTKLYMLYDELYPQEKDMPTNLIQRESITQLDDFTKEAKEILEELKKLNNK